jgi:hypothetical protein
MLSILLETLQFRSDNRLQPLVAALAINQQHVNSHHLYFPAEKRKCVRRLTANGRVHRRYYRLCARQWYIQTFLDAGPNRQAQLMNKRIPSNQAGLRLP